MGLDNRFFTLGGHVRRYLPRSSLPVFFCTATSRMSYRPHSMTADTFTRGTTLVPRPKGIRLSTEEGISAGLDGFGDYGGSIAAFMKSPDAKDKSARVGDCQGGGALPCDQVGSNAALQAAQAQYMAEVAATGKLPSPRDRPGSYVKSVQVAPSSSRSVAPPASPSSLPKRKKQSSPDPRFKKVSGGLDKHNGPPLASPSPSVPEVDASHKYDPEEFRTHEARDYYRSLPKNELTKEEMWQRITAAQADKAERQASAFTATEADYLRMEEELRENDLFHYRIGEFAYPDEDMRRDYYALWQLAMSLNKARWTMLDVHSQRGVKTTGAGMKLLFWKESVNSIMDHRRMSVGQFTDSHPILLPFSSAVERNPHMTKAFVRGFTDARLKVIQQPGSIKQLFDHFDKFYGYFYNSLLEVTRVKDENAEHMMLHIGRATGLTQHCVMFWKKYARIGFTMLPADLCADNHVNLALLKNIPLASRDRAVRKLLYDVMCIAKDEMLHATQLASGVSPTAWPIVMECLYANYYLGFLQRREFNVSAMFADYNIENAGFVWYRMKKRWEWNRYQSIERLVSEPAPLPWVGTSLSHRGSDYKMATGFAR